VIAATNRDLLHRIEQGEFREDLYFRIAGIRISVPPLRERRSDIPALAEALLRRLSHPKRHKLDPTAVDKLLAYDYPGNIRELRSILQNALSRCEAEIVRAGHILIEPASAPARPTLPNVKASETSGNLPSMDEVEAQLITQLLKQHKGNRAAVAYVMGVSERTVYRKMKRYDLG
jgi:transcriptional regulator with PAS, ATPase and Fis domain